jgi:hypothetical protein
VIVGDAVESLEKKGYFTPRPRPWKLGFRDRGLGREDFAVLDRFGDLVVEVENKVDAELIILAVNAHTISRESFKKDLGEWQRETQLLSFHKKDHPAYQRIVAMGRTAIPFILDELRKEPSWIVIALFDITGENPALPGHAGRLNELTNDWLEWAQQNGY